MSAPAASQTDAVVEQRAALRIRQLSVTYPDGTWAVRDLSLEVRAGECLGIVGESGCGKSTIARAVLGLLPSGTEVAGSISIAGIEVVGLPARELRRLRGRVMGLVAQDPFGSFDPLMSVGSNVAVAWRALRRRPPRGQVGSRLTATGIDGADEAGRRRPHTWSGGMLQRASIVAATAHRPPLLIADEPTSALDAHLAERTVGELVAAGSSVVLISHDLRLVARHADRLAVLYGGRVVEEGPAAAVVSAPAHPYTRALLDAVPPSGGRHILPTPIPGRPPSLQARTPGCAFADRCGHADARCRTHTPEVLETEVDRLAACHHTLLGPPR